MWRILWLMHERCSSLSTSSSSADVASCSDTLTMPAQLLRCNLGVDDCREHLTSQLQSRIIGVVFTLLDSYSHESLELFSN